MNHQHTYPRETNREKCQDPGCDAVIYWRLHKALTEGKRR